MTKYPAARIICLIVFCWPLLVSAATTSPPHAPTLPKPLAPLAQKLGLVVVKTFKTDAQGITGYVVKNRKGQFGVVYSYKDFLISGDLLNAEGKNLTQKYAQEHIPKPDYAGVIKSLAGSPNLVSEGKPGTPEIYVFADPNCYFCRKLWLETRNWVDQGKVRIHWILVGFLKKSSAGRSAAILAAADRAKALTQDEEHFDLKHEEGGIAELKPIPKKWQDVLDKHLAIMGKLRFQGTPGLVFKDVHGQWQGTPGVPPMDKFAKELGI
ncbi:MAG: thiol:disulfide interchange protein DsbG [Gammaproteobacteria bacterium]